MEKEITLIEALTGLDFILVHLDGRKIRIKNNPGEVIKPDDIKTVEHMGMPFAKKTYMFGNLFIHFKIKFPATMDVKNMGIISEALQETNKKSGRKNSGGKKEESKNGDVPVDETVEMKTFEEHHRNLHHGGGDRGNDSEEEEEEDSHGGQRVGCQSQ